LPARDAQEGDGKHMREKRQAQRRSVKEVAKIVIEDRRSAESCVVLDASETGARLLVNSVAKVPRAFLLFRKSPLSLREAVVVRRELKCVGVTLSAPLDPASARVKALSGMKDLAPLFS
jgi:hypothetical protein